MSLCSIQFLTDPVLCRLQDKLSVHFDPIRSSAHTNVQLTEIIHISCNTVSSQQHMVQSVATVLRPGPDEIPDLSSSTFF